MDILILLFLFIGGIAAGSFASVVGGGGLLSLPILFFVGLSAHQAIATNRFAVVLLEFVSALRFNKANKIHWRMAIPFCLCAMAGSAIGAIISLSLDTKMLNVIISPLMLIALWIVLDKDKFLRTSSGNPKSPVLVSAIIFLLSIYGGFLGTGYGFFVIIALTLFGLPFIESAALARVVGFCMSFVALLVFLPSGTINYAYGLSLGLGYAIGSWIGIGVALKKGEPYIKGLLVVVGVLTAAKLLFDAFAT